MASKTKKKKSRTGPGTACRTPKCSGTVPKDGHWARQFCDRCSPPTARRVHARQTALRRARAKVAGKKAPSKKTAARAGKKTRPAPAAS